MSNDQAVTQAQHRVDQARTRLDRANAAIEHSGIGPSSDPNLPLGQIVDGTARSKRKAGERNDAQLVRLAQAFRDRDNAARDLRGAEVAYARETLAVETVKGVTPERLADARLVKAGGSWYEVGPIKPGAKTAKAKGMDYRVSVAKVVDVKTNDDVRRERLAKAGLDPDQAPTVEQAAKADARVAELRTKAAEADNADLARLHNEHADMIAAHLRTDAQVAR